MKKHTQAIIYSLIGATVILATGCQSTSSRSASAVHPVVEPVGTKLFGWPFLDGSALGTRGGSTSGGPVVLEGQASAGWIDLQMPDLTDFERDRLAILAMAGDYRVSFQFYEIAGLIQGYDGPAKPYFSWSTERVQVMEDHGDFISLQHTLVMFFEDDAGVVGEPILVKHWRQDWSYEDTSVFGYVGGKQWEKTRLPSDLVQGTWSQTVYQVDDSPRYEVSGKWIHGDNLSTWQSNFGKRPMPRREYSVRDDYNLLEGWNTVTILPDGWLHEQSNFKLAQDGGQESYVAKETGVNRYDRISEPNLEAADAYWKRTAAYWSAVRGVWKEVYAKYDKFELKSKVDGKKLYEVHFEYAGSIESATQYDVAAGAQHAREAIESFLILQGFKDKVKIAY